MFELSVLRILVVALLALSIGTNVAVIRLYFVAVATLKTRVGLTPIHVVLVSSGVLITQIALGWALIDGLTGNAPTVVNPSLVARTVMFGLGAVIILAALFVVGGIQRKRIHFAKTEDKRIIVETVKRDPYEPDTIG